VVGVLKGYDQLMNLVLDEAVEYLRGELQRGGRTWLLGSAGLPWSQCSGPPCSPLCACTCPGQQPAYTLLSTNASFVLPFFHPHPADPEDPMRVTDQTRPLGLIVCRGTSVMLVVPTAGTEEIANPFQQADGMEA
jgi:small nuclear ribonucleoprotein (snRNP)-like protein